MALEKLRQNFVGRAVGASMAGLAAFAPMAAGAQDAQNAAMQHDCGVMSAEICELDNMADAAREYAETNQSVAILFHIGDDIRARADGEELMQKAETYFRQQFAEHGIAIETFSRANLNADATGLTYHYGHLIYQDAEGSINLNLKEGIEAIPEVAVQLSVLRQMTELDQDEPTPNVGG